MESTEPGLSRRSFLTRVALLLASLPLLRLGEAVARADKRRKHHRGASGEMWIGHC